MGAYLVTGAAGFIGSAIASALLRAGHTVTGLDAPGAGRRESLPAGLRFIEGDCRDGASYARLPQDAYDAVFHAAGRHSGGLYPDLAPEELPGETAAMLHLLRFARQVGCARVIFAGGMSVYGRQADEPVREQAAARPDSFHGLALLTCEHLLRLHEPAGIRGTSLRLGDVYGPGREDKGLSMIDTYMDMMLRDKHILVRTSPNRCRDFLHIDDAVRAFLACLEQPRSAGMALNVSGSGKVTVGELVDKLRALSSEPVTVEYAIRTGRELSVPHADINNAAKYLGYEAEIGLDEALADLYALRAAQSPAAPAMD